MNKILNREKEEEQVLNFLNSFTNTSNQHSGTIPQQTQKNGLFIYSETGTGKTSFIKNILNKHNYDMIIYNACDVRNKLTIDTICKKNGVGKGIKNFFNKNTKPLVIVMDEIDGMSGDKGGLSTLIKIMKVKDTNKKLSKSSKNIKEIDDENNDDHDHNHDHDHDHDHNENENEINENNNNTKKKKTKTKTKMKTNTKPKGKGKHQEIEQKPDISTPTHSQTQNPIICIGNHQVYKKIKELMNVCISIHLKKPTKEQMKLIINNLFLNLNPNVEEKILNYCCCDLRKLNNIYELYTSNPEHFLKTFAENSNSFFGKTYNENINNVIRILMKKNYEFIEHNNIICDTDRTTVGLLYHENIVDLIDHTPKHISIPFYIKIINNICLSDYIDRITFQKQIWIFNEMSSLIKTFYNNKLYHQEFFPKKSLDFDNYDVRFTKVLTKYSSEYNNNIFIQNLCQKFMMDKKDLFSFFNSIHHHFQILQTLPTPTLNLKIYSLFEGFDITNLEINRLYKYIDGCEKTNTTTIKDSINNDEMLLLDPQTENVDEYNME